MTVRSFITLQRRSALKLGIATGATLVAPSWGAAQGGGWKISGSYGEATHHMRNLRSFADGLAGAWGSAVPIEMGANGSLRKMPEVLAALEKDEIQAGEVLLSSYAKDFPLFNLDALPFIVRGLEDARAMWDVSRPVYEQELAKRGLTALYAVPWPAQGLYSRDRVEVLGDLKGQKFRVYNDATKRLAEISGAEPVTIPAPELPKAIEDGRVDAMITSSVTGVDAQVWKAMKHFYDVRAWIPKNVLVASRRAVDRLSNEQRVTLLRAAGRAETLGWALADQADATAQKALAANKVKIDKPSADLRRALNSAGDRMSREWAQAAGFQGSALLLAYFNRRKA